MKFGMNSDVKIMGVVNVNEDSFYAPSRAASEDAFCRRVDSLLERGATIIDIGAVSSRPGATLVGAADEWRRLEPALHTAARRYGGVAFSIDTFRSETALRAFEILGKYIVNDISAGAWDGAMLPLVGKLGLPYVAMHLQGTFETMHDSFLYDDVVGSVVSYFRNFEVRAKETGIKDWILDPGFGFSKSSEDNMILLRNLPRLKEAFGRPVLVGISHKRFTAGRLEELEAMALELGASILRTHL